MAPTTKTPKNHIRLGAYDVKGCLELLHKNSDPSYLDSWKDEVDTFTQSILDEGNAFESEVVGPAIAQAIASNITIDTTKPMTANDIALALEQARESALVMFESSREGASLVLREDLTHELLENPGKVRVIWNPRLRIWKKEGTKTVWTNRSSEPDVLFRHGARNAVKALWGAIDVKSHNMFEAVKTEKTWKVSDLKAPYLHRSENQTFKGAAKKDDALQLAHYQRTLEFHEIAGDAFGGIVGKEIDGELKVVWIDLNESSFERNSQTALSLYDLKFDAAYAVVEREIERLEDPSLDSIVGPEWKGECSTCVWKSTCHDELSEADHITLLPGITPTRAKAHYAVGINEVAQMAKLNTKTAKAIDAGVTNLSTLVEQAKELPKTQKVEKLFNGRGGANQVSALHAAGVKTMGDLAGLDVQTARYENVRGLTRSIDQARVTDFARVRRQTHVFRARGIKTLEIPKAKIEIHVDMENADHVYLWGARVVTNSKSGPTSEHFSFVTYEATDEAEARVTTEFWKFLMDSIKIANEKYGEGNVLVFHYTAAEDRCLRHLVEKHAGAKGIPTSKMLEKFLASDVWVDLYPILTNQLVWPTENLTLKSLAKYVRFFWRDNDPSGANSVAWYQNAIDTDNSEAELFQERIIDYNADDCEATAVLLAWLQQFAKAYNANKKLASVEDLEERYQRPGIRRLKVAKTI